MRDLRSSEHKAKEEAEQEFRRRREGKLADDLAVWREWCAGTWLPIERCPFEALDNAYGLYGSVWVTDGKKIALATITGRCGRPIQVVREPEMAITDHGPALVGGEYTEIDAPDWWFKWEILDQFETRISYGDRVHCEIDFIPTHCMPAKPPLPNLT